jgi:hypothetical protein
MSYRVNAIEREIARQQMMQQSREIHAAQEAARKKPPGKVDIPEGTPDSEAKRIKFAAGFSSPEPESTTGKVDQAAPTRDKFAAGFGGKGETAQPTLLDQLMAYGERQAAQNTPMPAEAPAAAVEPSPQARRADESDASQGQQQAAEQLQLPMTTAGLFSQLEQKVATVTAPPTLPLDACLRQAFRELPGSQRQAIAAQIEAQDFGFPGYLGKYPPDYAAVLVGDALARRLADAQRLQPDVTVGDLIAQMVAAAQG